MEIMECFQLSDLSPDVTGMYRSREARQGMAVMARLGPDGREVERIGKAGMERTYF